MARATRIVGSTVTALLIAMSVVQPAAAEGWAKELACGSGYTCYMTTDTTVGVKHYYNGVLRASWSTSGYHSSSKAVNGTTMASASTSGSFLSHSASCNCTSPVCGV